MSLINAVISIKCNGYNYQRHHLNCRQHLSARLRHMRLVNLYLDKTCTPSLKYKKSKSFHSLLLCSLLSCQTNTHSSKQQQAGQCRNGELRNISFVVPILCAVYICLALAPVLGHICHLLPPFLSDNIIYFFFSGYPNVYKCPKRVCKGEMWNPVSCVSISVISAVFRGPQVHIMEKKNCF